MNDKNKQFDNKQLTIIARRHLLLFSYNQI